MSTTSCITEWMFPDVRMARRLWPLALGVAYVSINYLLGALTADHIVVGSLSLLDCYNTNTRRFLKYFFPFILTGVLYDSMRYYYWWGISGHIHVRQHYELDKLLFGLHDGARIVSMPEFFLNHTHTILDIVCGFAYLVFVGEYLAVAFWLFFKNKLHLLRFFGLAFITVNLIGFITYYIYPAAPPWYINLYGFGEARTDIQSNAAGAVRFDQIFGTHFFDQIYGRGIDVYGSIPSLHVAYPLLVAWIAWRERFLFWPAIGFYVLMCFSAIYLQHHHVVDILLGTFYALTTIPLVSYAVKRLDARTLAERNSRSSSVPGVEVAEA